MNCIKCPNRYRSHAYKYPPLIGWSGAGGAQSFKTSFDPTGVDGCGGQFPKIFSTN